MRQVKLSEVLCVCQICSWEPAVTFCPTLAGWNRSGCQGGAGGRQRPQPAQHSWCYHGEFWNVQVFLQCCFMSRSCWGK